MEYMTHALRAQEVWKVISGRLWMAGWSEVYFLPSTSPVFLNFQQ